MSRKLLAGTVALGACILAVVFGRTGEPKLTHVRSLSALLAHPVRDLPLRVHGALVKGSLCKEAARCGYRFVLTDTYGASAWAAAPLSARPLLSVRYPGCLFSECVFDTSNIEVDLTVDGKLGASPRELEAAEVYTHSPEVCHWLANLADAEPMVSSDLPLCAAR
jgi:hypothetical protein